jgi:hypothetical protein
MVKLLSLLCALIFLAGGITLWGLLTNWFRYGLSLEATVVAIAIIIACVIVLVTCSISYIRSSTRLLVMAATISVISGAFVLYVHNQTMGEFPRFYFSHIVKSPPDVIQTKHGALRYWVELHNPFSDQHEEFLVVGDGKVKRIKIQPFTRPIGMYVGASKPSDWSTLSLTEDPNIAILTIGPSLAAENKHFQVNLSAGTATILPNN